MMDWVEPKIWTSKRRITHTDINNQEGDCLYLKDKTCDNFYLSAQIGSKNRFQMQHNDRVMLLSLLKRLPPLGNLYLRSASRISLECAPNNQIEGIEHPTSPVQKCIWHPCPEINKGTYNKVDPDPFVNSYLPETRWSGPFDTSNYIHVDSWDYGYPGHLMVENPSSTLFALIQLTVVYRNLDSSATHHWVNIGDCGYFHFVLLKE
jgi:hypothetical protein